MKMQILLHFAAIILRVRRYDDHDCDHAKTGKKEKKEKDRLE